MFITTSLVDVIDLHSSSRHYLTELRLKDFKGELPQQNKSRYTIVI
jgi:hypothetical protein